MISIILTKLFVGLFTFSCLNILRHIFKFIMEFNKDDGKFTLTDKQLIYLGISISLFITGIVTGFSF